MFLGDIIADPRNRKHELALVPFVIRSEGENIPLPRMTHKVKEGDQLLFCGTEQARNLLKSAINSEYDLFYLRTGKHQQLGILCNGMSDVLVKHN